MAFYERLADPQADGPCACKLILLGEAGAGKSSLWYRFKTSKCLDKPQSTVGMDIATRSIAVGGQSDVGAKMDVNLWDTGGTEKFRDLTSNHYKHADGVLLVFSANSKESLRSLAHWMGEAKRYAENVPFFFLRNKMDLDADEHKAQLSDVQAFFSENTPKFQQMEGALEERLFHTSAIDPEHTGFDKAMASIVDCIHKRKVPRSAAREDAFHLSGEQEPGAYAPTEEPWWKIKCPRPPCGTN